METTTNPEANMTGQQFNRTLRNLEGMWYRLDNRMNEGRNSASTERTMDMRYRQLRDAVAADAQTDDAPLCTWLDDNPKVAARWNRMERRHVGLTA